MDINNREQVAEGCIGCVYLIFIVTGTIVGVFGSAYILGELLGLI